MRVLRRTAVLILLTLTLGTPSGWASPLRPATSTAHQVFDYLGGLLTSFWLKGGCVIDPNGHCTPSAQLQNPDGGCTIDPNGGCSPATKSLQVEGGCTMDPDGRCAPGR